MDRVRRDRYETLEVVGQGGQGRVVRAFDRMYGRVVAMKIRTCHPGVDRRVVDRSDRLLAVWDGAPSQGLGGTADVVAYARRRGVPVEVVWPAGVTR